MVAVIEADTDMEGGRQQQQQKGKGALDLLWSVSVAKNPASQVAAVSKLAHKLAVSPAETDYTLTRLIRGLAAGSDVSRQNRFVCLCQLLRQAGLSCEQVLHKIDEVLHPVGSKGEEAEYLLGQLLALSALHRAGLVQTADQKAGCLARLLSISSQRSYLLLPAINQIAEHYAGDDDLFESGRWAKMTESLSLTTGGGLNVDTLYLLLAVQQAQPAGLPDKIVKKQLGSKKFASKKLFEEFVGIVLNSGLSFIVLESHPVLASLVSVAVQLDSVQKMWDPFAEVMGGGAAKGQVGWAVLRQVARQSVETVPQLLTHQTLQIGLDLQLRSHGSIVQSAMSEIVAAAVGGKLSRHELVLKLLSASVSWDSVIPGNFVRQLMQGADKQTVMDAGQIYRKCLVSEGRASHRINAGQQLAKLVCHTALLDESAWKVQILKLLMETSVLYLEGEISSLSRQSRESLRESFYKGLDSRSKTVVEQVNLVLSITKHAIALKEKGAQPIKPLSEETQAAWAEVSSAIVKMEKSWREQSKLEVGVSILLHCQLGLQLFCQPEAVFDVLEELRPVQERWFGKKKPKAGRRDDDPMWVEVITEILLSLLALNKHLLRSVACSVWSVVCQHVNQKALDSILAAIGQGDKDEANDDKDSDDDEWMDASEDEGEEEDEEEETDTENGEEAGDSDDDGSDESDAEDKVSDEALSKVRAALGEHADEDNEEDIDMDDIPEEEMTRLDSVLAAAFKQLGGRQPGLDRKQRIEKLGLEHWRLRCLELVDTWFDHQPDLNLVIYATPRLLAAATIASRTGQMTLLARLRAILKKLSTLKKQEGAAVVGEDVLEVLTNLVDLATLNPSVVTSLNQSYPQLCAWLLRLAIQTDEPSVVGRAQEIYQKGLRDFFLKAHCVLPITFFQLSLGLNWAGSWELAAHLSEAAFSATTRQFRKSQALVLLTSVYRNQALLQSDQKDRLRVLTAKLLEKSKECIVDCLRPEAELKAKFLTELLNLLRAIKKSVADPMADWESITDDLEIFGSKLGAKRQQETRKAFSRLAALLKVKVVKAKPARSQENGVAPESTAASGTEAKKKKKKKKKSKEALKKKKELKYESSEVAAAEVLPSFADEAEDLEVMFKGNEEKKRKPKNQQSEGADESVTPKKKKKKHKKVKDDE